MKLLACLLLLIPATCWTQSLKITALSPHAYVYTTYRLMDGQPFPSNGMYLVGDSGVAIIDSPWDTTQFQPLLDSIERRHHKKVVMCIATHFHDDRTGALQYFNKKGIATWSSRQTKELCRINKEKQAEFVFVNDTVFTIGNLQFTTFYPGEGHTHDNIVIWFDQERILYGGCLLKSTENESIGYIKDANLSAWPGSVERLLKLYSHAIFVIPGHFAWGNKNTLTHTLRLLHTHKKD